MMLRCCACTSATSFKPFRYILPHFRKYVLLPVPGHHCATSVITAGISVAALSHPGSPVGAMTWCFKAGKKHWLRFQPAQVSRRHPLKCTSRQGELMLRTQTVQCMFGISGTALWCKLKCGMQRLPQNSLQNCTRDLSWNTNMKAS